MSTRWWPRSIQWQMFAGLLLLESLSLGLFAFLVTRQQANEIADRVHRHLAFQADSLAIQAREALLQDRPTWVGLSVRMMGEGPNVALAKITDPDGNVLFVSQGELGESPLSEPESAQIPLIPQQGSRCFPLSSDERSECVHAIYAGTELRGYAWVQENPEWEYEQLESIQRDTAVFGIIWIAASCFLVLIMARSIAQPLAVLHRGTQDLMAAPEDHSRFPLPVLVRNEMGDLIEAFNRMVASLTEQRAGLNDTLSLLDSMLANAPIGLAFVDPHRRLVRVNQVFAEMTGEPLPHHLGKTLPEVVSEPAAHELEAVVQRVFAGNEPVRNLEFSGPRSRYGREWTWLVNVYPVRTTPAEVRWVGIVAIDASERKRNEEALRNSEKLAVTGRLAASIAHEINNPLEAVTNLVFLLRNFTPLDPRALHYIEMLEYEVRRISEITQQTLRFYRQSTQPQRVTLAELLDSVLSLFRGRLNAFDIRVERRYNPQLTLHCFAGEIRQVVANLVGNAIDALVATGGELSVRAWRSHCWKTQRSGIRFVVADTGAGMEPEIRERVFEPFFTTKEATGTGLGLWVTQEIITKHQGTILLRTCSARHSSPPHRSTGTVFQFFIPDGAEAGAEQNLPD